MVILCWVDNVVNFWSDLQQTTAGISAVVWPLDTPKVRDSAATLDLVAAFLWKNSKNSDGQSASPRRAAAIRQTADGTNCPL
jgi:hypothetical protein